MQYKDHHIESLSTTLGFDIEFALLNTRGDVVAAIPYMAGTKERPQNCAGGNMQRDNVAFEIAVDYSSRFPDTMANIRSCLQAGIRQVPKGYTISCIPSAIFPDKELKHAEANEFRCEPDFDAKTGHVNEFTDIVDPNLRSFGLHVHTGASNLKARTHVLTSDLVLGLFSTLKDNSPEALIRRKLYGKPSSYRPKDYGVEYRTLSNYFCKSPRLIKMVYALNRVALLMSNCFPAQFFETVDTQEVSDVIMAGDEVRASELFFQHVHAHCDFALQRLIIDELEYDNYRSFEEEWGLDYTEQRNTTHQALRGDYYQPPVIQKEKLI